tara:strand:+ start:181 stop:1182 length:1002 start_codon:yes stop_codon:yes gene_type:complete
MINLKESNKVTHSVWHLPKFIQRDHVREYTSLLKSFSANGLLNRDESEWILNNLDLDATQGLVNPNTIPSQLDEMAKSIKNLNSGKVQLESASLFSHDIILYESLTPEYKKIIDLDLPFNKQLQKLSDEIIKYANEKYEVDDWKLYIRSHNFYPPLHCINPHTHWPESQITVVIPLNDKPIGGEGGDMCLIDGRYDGENHHKTDLPNKHLHEWMGKDRIDRSNCVPNSILDSVGANRFPSKMGEVFIFDDVSPLPGYEIRDYYNPTEAETKIEVSENLRHDGTFDWNMACWWPTAHCVSRVENWCRATMLLWFESYKVKLNKPKNQRGGFAIK